MRPGDALVSIQEYAVTAPLRRHLIHNFPPKSLQLGDNGLRFGLEGLRFGRVGLGGRRPRRRRHLGTIPFSEAGRAFDALVYFRGRPSTELRDAAADVLAELVFEKQT